MIVRIRRGCLELIRLIPSLLFVFSACGEISTGRKLPVLTAYFLVLAQVMLEKMTLEDCLTRLYRALLPKLEQVYGFSNVADCQALTLP